MKKLISFIMTILICMTGVLPCVYAADNYSVDEVVSLLRNIDTLQQMQDNRSKYTASGHYDINTTDADTIAKHQKAKTDYETYLAEMFAKRDEAQKAYDTLSDEEKAQIDSALTEKLSNELPTKLMTGDFAVTPRNDEFCFEAVRVGTGFGYEVSNYMVSGQIPQTFILVDTSDGAETWSPSGKYIYNESNYYVGYCCDIETGIAYGSDYKRINLEDSDYFDDAESQHIRAILQNSYPFVSMQEMKDSLIAGGMDAEFVNSLNRADMIAAVQMAVWSFANINDGAAGGLEYFATIGIPKNVNIYFNPLHDYTNEMWEWFPGKRQRSFDEKAGVRVNTLAEHLINIEPVEAKKDQIVISQIDVLKTALSEHGDGTYDLTLLISLNGAITENSDVEIVVSSFSENDDGTVNTTSAHSIDTENGRETYKTVVNTKSSDTVRIEVMGLQDISKGVYFYESEGGRDASQTLVGVAQGPTNVYTSDEFIFTPHIEITPVEPDKPGSDIPESTRKHYIVFGKTEKIGWYSVSLDGGETFRTVFGNSNLEVAEGTEMIIRANDVFGDPFTFYINGDAVKPDENGYVRVTVDGFMLVGALGIPDVNVPDLEESLNWFQQIWKAIVDFFKKLFNL